MTDAAAEARDFFEAHPEIDAVDMIFTNMCGVPRGKRLRQHEALAVYESGRFLPVSVTFADTTGRDVEETGLLWETGDADGLCLPVPGTLVPAPWAGAGAGQFLVGFHELDRSPHDLDPRTILANVIGRLKEIGLTPDIACELEFYLLERESGADGTPRPALAGGQQRGDIQVYGLTELDDQRAFLDDLYAFSDAQGIPLESAISEYAAGQFELTLMHKADALRACDEAVMYKRVVKETARLHGLEATFMAKPFAETAGNGMHLHASLLDEAGKNAFASEDPEGSPLLRHAIGGMQALLADSFALFAPNANSYRRFRANSYAPVAPTWGVNNRTVSFRLPAGGPQTRHVEHRVCGADANPYLAMAAVLAAMHQGIVNKLDPGSAITGNGYEQASATTAAPMPANWFAAVDRFAQSAVLKDYMGERFVEVFAAVKRSEQDRYFAQVPRLDYDWYLRTA
ncbi:MAG TPA: glutamine synthetase family protein [Sphingomicrobium sp.]|jgi:glutamine synthetase|nr:glutamine synthetase family protein [Sphingomicrobium sp.]